MHLLEELYSLDRSSPYFLYVKLAITLVIVLKSIQMYQSRPTRFYYNETNKLMQQFLRESKIREMRFKPHFLLLWHPIQTITYLLIETFERFVLPIKTEDELFKCPDGGTVGIAWSIDKDGLGRPTGKHGQKPILLLCPGLGGKIDNLYTTAILRHAR